MCFLQVCGVVLVEWSHHEVVLFGARANLRGATYLLINPNVEQIIISYHYKSRICAKLHTPL